MQATIKADRGLFSYPKYWPHCLGTAPFLAMSKEEMDALGWDSCDVILVTGDAYVDHPSFGMAVIGRVLEAHGLSPTGNAVELHGRHVSAHAYDD